MQYQKLNCVLWPLNISIFNTTIVVYWVCRNTVMLNNYDNRGNLSKKFSSFPIFAYVKLLSIDLAFEDLQSVANSYNKHSCFQVVVLFIWNSFICKVKTNFFTQSKSILLIAKLLTKIFIIFERIQKVPFWVAISRTCSHQDRLWP